MNEAILVKILILSPVKYNHAKLAGGLGTLFVESDFSETF